MTDRALLAIDPGTRKQHARAEFDANGYLSRVAFIGDAERTDYLPVYVETPRIAFGGTVETVINLARAAERAVAWALTHAPDTVQYVDPSTWKGGRKCQHQWLVWDALLPLEKATVSRAPLYKGAPVGDAAVAALLTERRVKYATKPPTQFKLGDALDAIGLGLWALGRIDKYGRKK